MDAELVRRRDEAIARHERALAAYPSREGAGFRKEIDAVISELESITNASPGAAARSVDWAVTFRRLGDARFDRGFQLKDASDRTQLEQGLLTYRRAETILDRVDAPVEHAKLLVNSANTLRLLAGTTDGARMDEALRRYQLARDLFASHEPARVPVVDELIRTLQPMRGMLAALEVLQKAEPPSPAQASAESVDRLRQQVDGAGAEAMRHAAEGLEALRGIAAKGARGPSAAQVDDLSKLVSDLAGGVDGARPGTAQRAAELAQLRTILEEQAASGRVAPERAAMLRGILEQAGSLLGGSDSLEGATERSLGMRQVVKRLAEMKESSHGLPRPPEGSRAATLLPLWRAVHQALTTMATRFGNGEQETERIHRLFLEVARADSALWAKGADSDGTFQLERESLRALCRDVRQTALRHHLTWALPDFPRSEASSDPSLVHFAGQAALARQVDIACRRRGLGTPAPAVGEEAGQARFNQLRRANVALFDFTFDDDPTVAAGVAYELGLALTLGRTVIIVTVPGRDLPFDIAVAPVVLRGDGRDDERIADAIDAATYHVPSVEQNAPALLATGREVVARLGGAASGGNRALLEQLRFALEGHDSPDAVRVERALQIFLEATGPSAGTLLTPAWPPRYPAADRPRLFHVMPFQPAWSKTVSAAVAQQCGDPVVYRRHDAVDSEHVIRSLWEELGLASHALVDLSPVTPTRGGRPGINLNVAIELGICHALGKPTLLVGQEGTVEVLPSTLAKRRVHRYRLDDLDTLRQPVARFLRLREPEPRSTARPSPAPVTPSPPPAVAAKAPAAQRPGLLLMAQQFHAALARDQVDNGLANTLNQAMMARGIWGRPDLLAQWVQATRHFVNLCPGLLQSLWTMASESGLAGVLDPVLTQVEAYSREPGDLFPDHLGLVGLVDDAYLAWRVMVRVRQAFGTYSAEPAELQLQNFIRNDIIGEPFASQLDWMCEQILQGQSVAQAMQMLAMWAAQQQSWQGAQQAYDVERRVKLQLGALGIG